MGVSASLSPAIAKTGALMLLSQLSYSAASLNKDIACKWNALCRYTPAHNCMTGTITPFPGWTALPAFPLCFIKMTLLLHCVQL